MIDRGTVDDEEGLFGGLLKIQYPDNPYYNLRMIPILIPQYFPIIVITFLFLFYPKPYHQATLHPSQTLIIEL